MALGWFLPHDSCLLQFVREHEIPVSRAVLEEPAHNCAARGLCCSDPQRPRTVRLTPLATGGHRLLCVQGEESNRQDGKEKAGPRFAE